MIQFVLTFHSVSVRSQEPPAYNTASKIPKPPLGICMTPPPIPGLDLLKISLFPSLPSDVSHSRDHGGRRQVKRSGALATPDKCKRAAEVLLATPPRPRWNRAFQMPGTSERLQISSFKCAKADNAALGTCHFLQICPASGDQMSSARDAPILFESRG